MWELKDFNRRYVLFESQIRQLSQFDADENLDMQEYLHSQYDREFVTDASNLDKKSLYINEATAEWMLMKKSGDYRLYQYRCTWQGKDMYAIMIDNQIRYILDPDKENIAKAYNSVIKKRNVYKITHMEEDSTIHLEGDLDVITVTKRRAEQKRLREKIFKGKETETCIICGKEFPVQFLVASHIKRRSKSTIKERLDIEIVVPMCHFGCDALFEHGYIIIKDGIIKKNTDNVLTTDIEKIIDRLENKRCSAWGNTTKGYFTWHADYHGNPEKK